MSSRFDKTLKHGKEIKQRVPISNEQVLKYVFMDIDWCKETRSLVLKRGGGGKERTANKQYGMELDI